MGGMDPLLDDTVDFHTRLQHAQVDSEIQIFRGLPHGFWSLADWLPEAKTGVDLAISWITEACVSDSES